SYDAFLRGGGEALGPKALPSYLLSGGSPAACAELVHRGRVPEWVTETVRDWVLGESARASRTRRSLASVMEQLHRWGGTPVAQTKLARDAGLANTTVAAGWVDFLADLLCIGTQAAWDEGKRIELPRRPAKFPFINLLAAAAWAPDAPRSAEELLAL